MHAINFISSSLYIRDLCFAVSDICIVYISSTSLHLISESLISAVQIFTSGSLPSQDLIFKSGQLDLVMETFISVVLISPAQNLTLFSRFRPVTFRPIFFTNSDIYIWSITFTSPEIYMCVISFSSSGINIAAISFTSPNFIYGPLISLVHTFPSGALILTFLNIYI